MENNELEVLSAEDNTSMSSLDRAEIDVQVSTAKKYPRQLSTVKRSMMEFATLDVETAGGCFYKLPRGGKIIEGPSIRMAEIAISCFGNIRAGTRVKEIVTKGESPHVVVQGACFDLQNNVCVVMEKRRRIIGKKSKGGSIDEDDINLAVNSCSAIALRDAAFKVVPLALIKPCVDAAKRTATGDAKTLMERRGKMVEAFSKMGIHLPRILARVEKKGMDDIGLDELELLIGLFSAIKDGEAKIDECFPEPTIVKETPKEESKPVPSTGTTSQPMDAASTPAPKAPEQTTQPAAVSLSIQEKLSEAVTAAGFSFDDFKKYAEESGNIPDTSSLGSFDEVHEVVAKRLMRAGKHFIDDIRKTVQMMRGDA